MHPFHVENRPGQPVIATGPYRVLRHPSYTALWATLIGFALMCGTWLAVATSPGACRPGDSITER